MLLVDLSNWTIKWNTTLANDKAILNKAWSFSSREFSDEWDYPLYYYGFSTSAQFKTKKIKNKLINLNPEKD